MVAEWGLWTLLAVDGFETGAYRIPVCGWYVTMASIVEYSSVEHIGGYTTYLNDNDWDEGVVYFPFPSVYPSDGSGARLQPCAGY